MKKCLLPLTDLEPATTLIRRYVLAGTRKPVPVSRHRESTLFSPKVKKMTCILYGRHESVLTSFRMLPLPVAGSGGVRCRTADSPPKTEVQLCL